MRIIISSSIFLCLLVSSNVFACMNDIECGFGNQCVQPEGSVSIQGICVSMPPGAINSPSEEPQQLPACQFNSDCDPGFSCIKRAGELNGICVK